VFARMQILTRKAKNQMGLDNYWLVPSTLTEENMGLFLKASQSYDTLEPPSGVELESASYHGETPINLIGGMFSENGDGSFRGKYYSPLCDALLKSKDWLYSFHYTNDITKAFEDMKPYFELFQSDDAQRHWQSFVAKAKQATEDPYDFFYEYTIDDAIDFMRMFEYYSSVPNICIGAWY